MARIRMIKPELFDDPDIGALSLAARWLFVGLLTQADKRGRLADEPKRIKLRVMGFDARADVDALLGELAAATMVIRYQVDGRGYIQVRSFEKHQRPHPKEAESTIPAYSGDNAGLHGEPCNSTASRGKARASKPDPTSGSLDPTSGSLDPTSGSLGPGVEPETALMRRDDGFSQFYELYPASPHNPGPIQAEKAWRKLKPSPDLQATIIDAIRRQREWPQFTKDGGRFVPTPQKWLAEHRWLAPNPPSERYTQSANSRTVGNIQAGQEALVLLERMRA